MFDGAVYASMFQATCTSTVNQLTAYTPTCEVWWKQILAILDIRYLGVEENTSALELQPNVQAR